MDPSPLRPQTTMAIEKVNVAAKAAQLKEISTGRSIKRADCTESGRGDYAEWRNR